MRVTPGMTADNALYNLQQGRAKLDRIQEQVASGNNINRPSDDPISTRQILDLEGKIKEGQQYSSNITKGNLSLSFTDTTLTQISGIIDQAKKVTGQIASGSSDPTIRANAVSQLTELKKQLVDMGNAKLGDQYIFAGFKNNAPPFSQSNNDFNGSSDQVNVDIAQNSTVAVNISGGDLLKGTGSYGSVDILKTFDDIVTAINANNPSNIQAGLSTLTSGTTQISNAQADVAARMIRMQAAQNMSTQNQNTLKTMISNMQEVDYTKAGVELSQQQSALQAALSTTAKITNLSLLDYLS